MLGRRRALSGDEVIKILREQGFVEVRQRGSFSGWIDADGVRPHDRIVRDTL